MAADAHMLHVATRLLCSSSKQYTAVHPDLAALALGNRASGSTSRASAAPLADGVDGVDGVDGSDDGPQGPQAAAAVAPRARAAWLRATAYLAAGKPAQAVQVGRLVGR